MTIFATKIVDRVSARGPIVICAFRIVLLRGALMTPDKLPKYALIFRWGAFELNIVGRGALLAWASVGLAMLGAKRYFGI
jgi:hypothetical protein